MYWHVGGVTDCCRAERVLHHLIRHVRRCVVCSARHSLQVLVSDISWCDQSLEQVAEQFGVQSLLLDTRPVLVQGPVVSGEDCVDSRFFRIRRPVVITVQRQHAFPSLVAHEERAVQVWHYAQGRLNGVVWVCRAFSSLDVESFVKQVRQHLIVILI